MTPSGPSSDERPRSTMTPPRDETTLSDRALNRATLSRQLLLDRHDMSPLAAIDHLVGLQAQNPGDPYIALWSRLEPFDPGQVSAALERRRAVRAQLMRGTIHLVSSADYPAVAGATRTVRERVFRSTAFAKATAEVDLPELLEVASGLLDEQPRSRAELVPLLLERWPDVDGPSLAQAVTYVLPVVQVPPRGMWRTSGTARWATAESWLGRGPDPRHPVDTLVLRYLAAFGPASVADARTWSNLTGLAEVFERLEPELLCFRDERGRLLYDLPQAPRPPADTPAPVRFLPEYDNVLLAHADRSRIIVGVEPKGWLGNVLVDGFLAGNWKVTESRDRVHVAVSLLRDPPKVRVAEIEEEARRLASFLSPSASVPEVSFVNR